MMKIIPKRTNTKQRKICQSKSNILKQVFTDVKKFKEYI